MPTLSAHVPEDWNLMADFDAVVKKNYRGKPGPYIRDLIEKDLRGLSVGTSQSAYTIEQLGEIMRAEAALLRAERMARDFLFAEGSERLVIGRKLCEHLLDSTRRGSTYPEKEDSNALAAEGPGLPPG